MKRFLSLLLLVASSAFAQTQSATAYPTPGTGTFTLIEALEFARPDGVPLLLDLRIPDTGGPHPVIVYFHSGAWITGDRTGGPAIRQASRGYAVASIEYRLAPRYTFPAQIHDGKAAIRWLRANAQRFNLDPGRIALYGTSAGAHLAAIIATSSDRPELEGAHLGNPQFSSRVKAVVDYYGPTDLTRIEEQKLPCIPLDGNASYMPPSLLLGCPVQFCKEKAATASPLTYVTRDDPPFLIVHGLLDCLVPWQQSAMLHATLEAAGVSSTFITLPTGEHGGSAFDTQEQKEAVSNFLDKQLRGETGPRRRATRR